MAQDYEDIESTEVDGNLPFDEPDGLFPEDGTELVPTATGGAIQEKKDVTVLRALAKTPLVNVALARLGPWRPTAVALAARLAAKTYDDIQTPKGMQSAIADRAALRDPRLKAQRIVKKTKSELRAVSARLDTELAEIVAVLDPGEKRVGAIIKSEDDRKEAEKEKAREVEAARQRAHEEQIAKIRIFAERGKTSDMEGLQRLFDAISPLVIGDSWEDYKDRAQAALDETLNALRARANELREEAAAAALRQQAEEAARERQDQLDAAAQQLAAQQQALDSQQSAIARMTMWSALPAKFPAVGETEAEYFAVLVDELVKQAPDGPTYGAMLPIALLAHSTALAHVRDMLGAAMKRDMAARMQQETAEEAVPETPPPAAAPIAQAPTVSVWSHRSPAPAPRPQLAVPGFDEPAAAPAPVPVAREPIAEVDPMTATLNMGALNERFEFILKREFVEGKLGVPARREDRRAAFWTEDDYLLIAARIGLRMDAIVEAGMVQKNAAA